MPLAVTAPRCGTQRHRIRAKHMLWETAWSFFFYDAARQDTTHSRVSLKRMYNTVPPPLPFMLPIPALPRRCR